MLNSNQELVYRAKRSWGETDHVYVSLVKIIMTNVNTFTQNNKRTINNMLVLQVIEHISQASTESITKNCKAHRIPRTDKIRNRYIEHAGAYFKYANVL